MIWIFRSELATALQKVFAEEQLISDSEIPDDRHNGLPFYIDQRTPERDLNISQFWYIFCTYFNENLEYYRKCFEYKGQNSLHEYYFKLYRTQIRKDILSQIDPATASPGFLEHAIFFYTNANFGYLLQCLESGEPLPVVYDYSDPLCNLGHELMKYALRTYQH